MARRRVGKALVVPQGVSIAADFANLLLEKKSDAGQNVNVNDLALIYAYAVKESLANVYGDKLGSFATSFESSFNSTLRNLIEINDSTFPDQSDNLEKSKGVPKAALRDDKFIKTKLEDITKFVLFTTMIDLLAVGVFSVLACTCYGAYVFSRQRIMEELFHYLDDPPPRAPDNPTSFNNGDNAGTFYRSFPRYC
ncbi:hypothetical protein AALP_AA5G218900 [Arabis alpina]|uniref:Uncharacterized protein n=1 Tax=Arabis alpina TaxID=50452 RepID=A0A087GYM9_ARAAL|nr:hypothetical protein AALP_AA5G218900 [Arabis alpina]